MASAGPGGFGGSPKKDAAGLGVRTDGLAAGEKPNALGDGGPAGGGSHGPNLNNVAARKNLNETAFFFPHLISRRRRHRAASSSRCRRR